MKVSVNALASSVVMVCRVRPATAPVASRRDFQNALRRELPGALSVMMRENIAPVSEEGFLRAVDAQALFKLMWGTYNEVFREKLGFSGRNYLSELMEVRNEWAHGGAFTADQTAWALDTMHLLLRATSAAPEAEEVQKHQRAVMREIFEADQRKEVKRVTREVPQTQEGLLPCGASSIHTRT